MPAYTDLVAVSAHAGRRLRRWCAASCACCDDGVVALAQVLPATVNDVHQYLQPKVRQLPQSLQSHTVMCRGLAICSSLLRVRRQPFRLQSDHPTSTKLAEVSSAVTQSNYGLDWGFGAGHQVVTPSAPDREPLSVSH
jgi:hypothetical protein